LQNGAFKFLHGLSSQELFCNDTKLPKGYKSDVVKIEGHPGKTKLFY